MIKKIITTFAILSIAGTSLVACSNQPMPQTETTSTIEQTAPSIENSDNVSVIDGWDLKVELPEGWQQEESSDEFIYEAVSKTGENIQIMYYAGNDSIDEFIAAEQENLVDIGAKNISIKKTNFKIKGEEREGLITKCDLYGQTMYQFKAYIPKDNNILIIGITSNNDKGHELFNMLR